MSRISKLQNFLLDNEAYLISSNTNRFYLSNFYSTDGNVLITKDKAYLLVDFRYIEAARNKVTDLKVIETKKSSDIINELLSKENIKELIVEDEYITLSDFDKLKKQLKVELKYNNLSKILFDLRIIKDDSEIEKIKEAQKIAEKSYLEVLNILKPGVTERKISLELEHLMKLNGAEKVSFDLITITGKNTSLPHGVPTDMVVKEGDFFTFDIGCVYDGYCSDMTRTVGIKYLSDKQKEIYDIVLNAHNLAKEKIKPNALCSEVDLAAREYIESKGYGDYFGHTTGHGVGLDIHEGPVIYKTNERILEPSMVITDEPGIYLDNEFGVRIEDMYLVINDGCISLTNIGKELTII